MKFKNYSQRKACELVSIAPRVYRYQSTPSDDAELRKRLVELSAERRRFGYRRLHILLKREGWEHVLLWLWLFHKIAINVGRWILYLTPFVDGRRFRILCFIDDFSRECLAFVADTSLSGLRMTRELDAKAKRRGKSHTIVSDKGTEMTNIARPLPFARIVLKQLDVDSVFSTATSFQHNHLIDIARFPSGHCARCAWF